MLRKVKSNRTHHCIALQHPWRQMLLEPLVINHLQHDRARQVRRVQTSMTYETTYPSSSNQAYAEVNGPSL